MKRILLLLTSINWLLAACSPVLFQQIATLSSENVKLKDDGTFSYNDAIVSIEYDFWTESGRFSFIVTNKTDENIYLNLAESYFVNNGYANDYYQARTFVHTDRMDVSSQTSSSIYAKLSTNDGITKGKGFSIEYEEQPVICIPSHSSKVFEEFNISSSLFRECGFVRDPSRKETAIRNFSWTSSPRILENRLVFQIGEDVLPVINIFYVTEYQNIAYENATGVLKVEQCNGSKETVDVHKLSGRNKYYITYSSYDLKSDNGTANDRESTFFQGKTANRFHEGFYE